MCVCVCVCVGGGGGGGGISVYDKGGRTVSVHSSSPGPSFQGRQGGKLRLCITIFGTT